MKGLASAVLGLGLLLASRFASAAEPASARLELNKHPGTEQCIEQRALLHAVEIRLRRAAFRTDLPATLYVKIELEHSSDGWSAQLTMRDGAGVFLGRRSIVTPAAHCSALDESLALVVALLVAAPPAAPESEEEVPTLPEPAAQAETTPVPSPAPEPIKPRPASPPEAVLELPRDTPAPREPWRIEASLSGSAALGIVPGSALGGELGVATKAPHLPEIRWFGNAFARSEQRRGGTLAGAHFDFADLGLELCPLETTFGAVRWFGCAGQAIGRMRVASFGFDENTSRTHVTYALLLGSGLNLGLGGRFGARFAVRGELPLTRAVFTYGASNGSEPSLFEMKPITAVLDLGLFVRL